jgi:hypothetical protein
VADARRDRSHAVKRSLAVIALALAAGTAHAWEDATTHAGLTEAAALGSHLHAKLRALGFDRGLYEPLTIPPEDASTLVLALRQFPPTGGFVPDARGRQYALAWLVGGSVIADGPFAQHHFFDPQTGRGWSAPARGAAYAVLDWMARWQIFASQDAWEMARDQVAGGVLPDTGQPAPDWVASPANPLGVQGFLDQYAKAIRGATPGERSRAMAGALVAAGAIVHVLEDMGSPSHVRGDERAHVERVGEGMADLGSRFEAIAAAAYGRVGVPGPTRVVTRATLRAFFTSKDGDGLADETAARWFSANTLPGTIRIGTGGRTVSPPLVKPRPVPPTRLNLMAASQPQGTSLTDEHGVCLARYRVERGVLTFWLDDDCMLAEVDTILPEVSSYASGAIDFLFRGELDVGVSGGRVEARAKGALGAGQLELLAEDARGVRTPVAAKAISTAADGAAMGDAQLPDGTKRAVALYTGVDGAGEPIVAVGVVDVK